ncbi:catalase-related domain-containing protein [Arcanobacterium ihumii]|uniref:catalase-related domain-containing protein n=1 Tax=Arcanobacterium ihumii TaxID=2138162 RepID=UPI001F37B7E4|nr:catalase-related domain-containing protein [Arcanobacterium ihumii]
MIRAAYTLRVDDDDFTQPGILIRSVYTPEQVDALVGTVTGMLVKCSAQVRERAYVYWKNIDAPTGQRIEDAVHAQLSKR